MSVLAVAPAQRLPRLLHAVPVPEPAPPLTVTISVDGGGRAGRERVLAALRDLVAAAGPAVEVRAAPPDRGIVLHPESRVVLQDGLPLALSRLEYDLLLFFANRPRQVFSRGQLLTRVWGHAQTTNRTVDVHVSRLRRKLGDPDLITTVYGIGYRLADDAPVTVA